MSIMTRTCLGTLAVSAMTVLGSGMAAAQDADAQAQMESVQQPLEEAVAAGDWETVASMFAEDAVYLPTTGETVEGREAIQSAFEQNPVEAVDVRSSNVEMIGENMLFDIGTFTLTLPEEAGGTTFEGEYVSLTEMGENGPQIRKLITFPVRQSPEAPAEQ